MFVCLDCHKQERSWPADGLFESHGPCEFCGKVGVCIDCHGHQEVK